MLHRKKTDVKKTSEGIFICHCITREGVGAVLHSVEGLSARGEVEGERRPVLGSIQRQGTSGRWTLGRPPSSTSTSSRIWALSSSSTACVPVEAAIVEVLLAGQRGRGCGHLAVLCGGSHTPPAVLVEHKHGGTTLETRVSTLARPVSEHLRVVFELVLQQRLLVVAIHKELVLPVAGLSERHIAVCVILAQSWNKGNQ